MYGVINKNYFPKDFRVSLREIGLPTPDSRCLRSCFFPLQSSRIKQMMLKTVIIEN